MNFRALIRTVPNFPKQGINFRDITPLLADGPGFRHVVSQLAERYAGKVDEPRALLERFGADISEVERNRENPYCCGAGGGLLFNDKEEEQGTRISDVRFKQLQATGANTVVTACPFCSIMLKGAGASAQSDTQFVDLMTYVNGKLQPRA